MLGARCPQQSSSWSSPSKSRFVRHPSEYRSDTSRSFSKPLQFGVPASIVNLLFEDTPKIVDRKKLRNSKGSMSVGLKMGVSALVLSTFPLLSLFQLWPKVRTSDYLVCPNSMRSLLHNFSGKVPLSISSLQPVSSWVRWLFSCHRWSWRDGYSSFLASLLLVVRFLPFFMRFFLPLCIGTLG